MRIQLVAFVVILSLVFATEWGLRRGLSLPSIKLLKKIQVNKIKITLLVITCSTSLYS